MVISLSVLAFASAAANIIADYSGRRRLVYIFKPAAMIFILALAGQAKPTFVPAYKRLLLAGLAVSLLGDIFMMLRDKKFTEGLVAFLGAHVLYIAAFLQTMSLRLSFAIALPLILYALFMTRILFPYLGRMKFPVVLYILVITVMAGLAAERYIFLGGRKALSAFLGAILFVVSDSILAINRFARKFKPAQALILGTYFAAQWLLAMSV